MGWRFRKSVNVGLGFRINISKSGIGYSWGVPGYRKTWKADGSIRTTYSIPGTGISYVEECSSKNMQKRNSLSPNSQKNYNLKRSKIYPTGNANVEIFSPPQNKIFIVDIQSICLSDDGYYVDVDYLNYSYATGYLNADILNYSSQYYDWYYSYNLLWLCECNIYTPMEIYGDLSALNLYYIDFINDSEKCKQEWYTIEDVL